MSGLPALPGPVARRAAGYRAEPVTAGLSGAEVWQLAGAGRPDLFLKAGPARELAAERDRLRWLRGRLPVPEVVAWAADGDRGYLLTTGLPGRDAAGQVGRLPAERIAELLALGLRRIHAVPVEGCPFVRPLSLVLAEAQRNLAAGRVDVTDFDPERRGRDPADLFEELVRRRPSREEIVFTHGDYCLPNVILCGEHLSGFVDWGRAGLADRYQDIGLAVRSIRHNLGGGLEHVFLAAYGLPDPDWDRIAYYQLLDEFF